MGRLNFRGGQAEEECEGNLFCVCLERMGASYTPHSVNLARAVASSRLHSGVLSWAGCPGEGHLQQPQTLVKRRAWQAGRGGAGMERCLVVPGNGHVLDLWNPQVGQSDAPKRKYLSLCFPRGPERRRTLPAISGWNQKLLLDKSYGWSESAGAGNHQNKQHKVYRSAGLPTETIFSIHLVGLTKHHVFEVYQTLSHPRRPEGGLNHLIYWVLEDADTQNLSTMQAQKIEQQAVCALISTLLYECLFWKGFIFTQATPSVFCHFGMTQGSKNHQVSCGRSRFQNLYGAGSLSARNSI